MLNLASNQHLLKYKKSRPVHRYLHQFDQLVFCQGVLHRVYEQVGAKYHQLILPSRFGARVMELLYNEQGHQAVENTLQLVCQQFYWSTLFQVVTNCVKNISGVKLAMVLILIQIHHRGQL